MKVKKETDLAALLGEAEAEPSYEIWDEDERIVLINNQINGTIRNLIRELYFWTKQDKDVEPYERKPIKILMDCPGGECEAARSLVDIINTMVTPVYTINIGSCSSAAVPIFAAGFKRFAFENSSFMIHDGQISASNTYEKVKSCIRYNDELTERMDQIVEWATDIRGSEIQLKGVSDWYFFADEAVKLGLVDEIIEDFDELCM